MKKTVVISLIIIVAIIGLAFTLGGKFKYAIDWEESFNEKSNKPYGVSVLYKELSNLFNDRKIRTVYHTPFNYLYANSEEGYGDHVAEGNFIIIGNSDYLEYESIDELLLFVERGNMLFISDYNFPTKLTDTLKINIEFELNQKDSISQLSFKNQYLLNKSVTIDKNEGDFYFKTFDYSKYNVLGYSKTDADIDRVNFIEVPFGDGNIYLHLQPKIFTNYNILKDDRYKYIEGALSYLPDADIYFDSYTKYYNSYNGDVEEDSNLGWFLSQISFKWAWYFALFLTLLFIIFNAKRRQRIIKSIKPLENTTVAFVKTISNLYFETQDHKNLIDKKIKYFLEKVRTDYNLDTSNLNDEFITKLTAKSGKKKERIEKLINYIKWLRKKREFFEENLINLNRHIEDFYSK